MLSSKNQSRFSDWRFEGVLLFDIKIGAFILCALRLIPTASLVLRTPAIRRFEQ